MLPVSYAAIFNFLSLILDIYVFCFFLVLIPKKARSYARFFLSGCLYLLAIINAFCVEHFYARISPEILNVILETNYRESSEFVDKYIKMDIIWSGVGIILLLLLFRCSTLSILS